MMQTANAEAFATLAFSGDGEWLCTGSTLGLPVYRWAGLLALDDAAVAQPVYKVNAQPGALSHFTYCYTIAVDEVGPRVLFAGLQGIVEALDLATGSVSTVLALPELLGITRIGLSVNRKILAAEAKHFELNSCRPAELTIWDYEKLIPDVVVGVE